MSLTAHEKLSMFVNLKKGDTILTGRFKNSPKTVKSFGTDDKNQPTVNGSPALSFRIKKLMPAKAKESTMLLPIEQRLIRLNARKIASDKTASVFPWFMTTGGAFAGGSAGAAVGRQIGENMSDSRTGRRIGTIAGGLLGALGGGYAGYRLAPAFGIEEAIGAGPRTGTYGDVMRRGGLLGAMSGAATGGLAGGLEGAVTGGLTGIPLGIGLGALSRYAADRSYGSTTGSRRKVNKGEFFGTAPKMSYYGGYNPYVDKRAATNKLLYQNMAQDLTKQLASFKNRNIFIKYIDNLRGETHLVNKFKKIVPSYYEVVAKLNRDSEALMLNRDVRKIMEKDLKKQAAPRIQKAVDRIFRQRKANGERVSTSSKFDSLMLEHSRNPRSRLSKLDRLSRKIGDDIYYDMKELGPTKMIAVEAHPEYYNNVIPTRVATVLGTVGLGGAGYAATPEEQWHDRFAGYGQSNPYVDKKSSSFPLLSTLTGATLGGVTGAGIGMHAQSGRFTTPKDRYRNMLIGGILGAGLGGVGGYYAAPYGRMEDALVAPAMVGTPADAVARGMMTGGFSGGVMSGLQRYAGEAGRYRR